MSLFIDQTLIQDLQQIDSISQKGSNNVTIRTINNLVDKDYANVLSSFYEHEFQVSYKQQLSLYSSVYDGLKYVHSIEQAYQLQKIIYENEMNELLLIKTPLEAKQYGTQHVTLRKDWENVKVPMMMSVCLQAALQCSDIMGYLRQCDENVYFVDNGQVHKDSFWADYQNGQNMYGKIWTTIHRLVTKSLSIV